MWFYFPIFLLGLAVGSFLNCVIYRLGQESFLKGRSYCPHCEHELGWKDLLPVVSYLFLKGECRYCGHRISLQYPLVELATGFLFVLVTYLSFVKFVPLSFSFQLLVTGYRLLIASCLLVIFVYDLKNYIVPNSVLIVILTVITIGSGTAFGFGYYTGNQVLFRLLTGLGAAAPFLLVVLASQGKWMGMGDVKLALVMGLLLGWPRIAVGLFSAFVIGGIMGTVLLVVGRKSLKSKLPFAPLLVLGTFIAWGWGFQILNWYLSLLVSTTPT